MVGVQDGRWGEAPVAFVVLRRGADQAAARRRLEEACARSLARYKAPRDYRFLAALPRNAMGKVLKRELRQQPAP